MKGIAFILSMILLGLAFHPCSDALSNSCDKIEIGADNEHDHADHQEDNCTPLCGCICCGMTIGIVDIPGFSVAIPSDSFCYLLPYAFTYEHTHAHTLWRPPFTV